MIRSLFAAALLAFAAAPARAAATSWIGGPAGDWNVPGNWSAGVPGPSDDAAISSAFVVAYATDAALSVNSLTLGAGGVLQLSTGFTAASAATLQAGSALQFGTTAPFFAGTLWLQKGSSAAYVGAPFAAGPVPALTLQANRFVLDGGSTITVSGRGYAGGLGGGSPTAGSGPSGGGGVGSASAGGGGGGHGGAGGDAGGAVNGVPAYDSPRPADGGAGGGGAPNAAGGAGGGLLVVQASTADLNGLLCANGLDGLTFGFSGGGGGAGGGVVVLASVITGTGTITAKGGLGGSAASQGGGGGGGLIWLRETSLPQVLHSTLTVVAGPGLGGSAAAPGNDGSSGSLFADPRHWTNAGGDFLASNPANWNLSAAPVSGQTLIFGSSATAARVSWDLAAVAVGSVTMTPAYSTTVVMAASMTVTGTFAMSGGTIAAAPGLTLSLGGDVLQTGGRFDLLGSTMVLAAGGRSAAAAFVNARAGLVRIGGAGIATATVSGALSSVATVEVSSVATLSLAAGATLGLSGDGPFAGAGTVVLSPASILAAEGSAVQTWKQWPGVLGGLTVSNPAGLVLSTSPAARFPLAGGVTVSTGASLTATAALLEVGGDWANYGAANLALSTVAFKAVSGTQTVSAGGTFDNLVVDDAGAALRLSTWVVVASSVGVLSGTLDLAASTISVRGRWTESPGALVLGGTSVAIFDGVPPQTVYQRAGNSFGAFLSSCAGGVSISSTLATTAGFEWHRGNLAFPGATLTVGGSMLVKGGILLSAAGSQVIFNGSSTQTVTFLTLGDVTDANTSAAGLRLQSGFMTVGSLRVRPGAVLDGGLTNLTVTGSVWDTAFSTYLAISPGHSVLWQPAGAITVGAGSVVNAKLALDNGKTAVLQGDLNIGGLGNQFDPRLGSTVINAPGGSTIAFRGSANLNPTSGASWTYGGDVANSWLVFEGSGAFRGANLPSNLFGTLRVSLNTSADMFRAGNLNLAGSLIVEGGTFRPNGAFTVSVGGDVRQTGGVVDYATLSTGTLRLTGPAPATISLVPGSHTLWHLTDASTASVTAASDLTVRGDFVVAAGTFSAGAGRLALQGLVQISSGASFAGQGSTVTLDGFTGGRPAQSLAAYGPTAFNGLAVNVQTANLLTSVSAAAFTDRIAGGTLTVAAGATLTAADLRLGPPGGAYLTARSAVPGVPWFLDALSFSSATAVAVADSDASSGVPIVANDGRSADGGGNLNWNFRPLLLVLLPGESFTPSAAPGKTGTPSVSTAGAAISASVIAVSSRWEQAYAATGTVVLASDDAFAALPPGQALVNGAAVLSLTPYSAEPSPRATRVAASAFFGSGVSTASVIPSGLARLQILMPGEAPLPGSPAGSSGTPFARVRGVPFPATVRAVDAYWNKIATVTDSFSLGSSASSSTIPAPPPLAAGQASPSGLVIYTTGSFTLNAADLTNPGVLAALGRAFGVVPPSVSSPTGSFYVPTGAAIASLGGAISGTAADGSSVERVRVDVLEVETGLHYDGSVLSFSAAAPIFATTTLASPLAPSTSWSNLIPDSALVGGRHYAATALVDDPSGFTGTAASTFTVDRAALTFGSRSGQGAATVLPASAAGCAPVVATVTFTAGPAGIGPGGALAVRVPDGWNVPAGVSASYPPPPGFWNVASTSPALAPGSSTATVNAASFGAQSLGAGWLTLTVATNSAQSFAAGQKITLTYSGQPPLSPAGRGPQAFAVWSAADASAPLAPISSQPALGLTAGATSFLAFADASPLTLAPLQFSSTIQLKLVDLCGNDKPGASSGTASLSLVVPSAGGFVADATAKFYSLSGATISAVSLSTGFALSPGFTMAASTSGPALAYVQATASFTAVSTNVFVTALRAVVLAASSAPFTSVSADTGTLSPGTTSVALSASAPDAYPARLVFTLAPPSLTWDAVLSLDAVNFSSPVFRAAGAGGPSAQVLTWDGVDRVSSPPRYAAPGRYKARLRAAGGAITDRTLEVIVSTTPGYAGRLGAGGAFAAVRASGPGAGEGAYAQASSTGYFVLAGLRAGQAYQLSVATTVLVSGQPAAVAASFAAGPAAVPLTDLGSLSLPAQARVRVAAILPVPAPFETVGGYVGRAADGSAAFSGALRFSTGSATSDDGGPLFGRAASTWSAAYASPGVYTLELEVPDLRLSTSIAGVVVGPGGLDAVAPLDKLANVYGRAILPFASPGGVTVTVQATKAGQSSPSAIASILAASSGPYALFGLEPGSWTVSASAPGYAASSAAVAVAGAADVSGLDLTLGAGGSIAGNVSVLGGSLGATQCFASGAGGPGSCPAGTFDLNIEALAVGTLDRGTARARVTASAGTASAAYAVTGLAPGLWTLRTSLPGYALTPAGGTTVTVAAGPPASANLTLAPVDARLRLTVLLPPLAGGACRPASAWTALGLAFDGADGTSRTFGDATALAGAGSFETLHCSSATFFSPALPPGPVRAAALFAASGAWAYGRALLADGATAALTLDLTASSASVSGLLSVSGLVSLSTRTAGGLPYSLAASSAAGILSAAPDVAFCLLGSADPAARRALRAELLPLDPSAGVPALRRATGGAGSCAALPLSTAAATSLGFAAAVNADGSFTFSPGVAPGTYLLRVPGDLDDNAADGDEAVAWSQVISVGPGGAYLLPRLGRGARVSGALSAPATLPAGRLFRVSLLGPGGSEARGLNVSASPGGSAPFSFDGVGDGRYALTVTDLSAPRAFAAAPLAVAVAGADVAGLSPAAVAAGAVRARLAAARLLPDGTQEAVLITRDNAGLLGSSFRASAAADPAGGGTFYSRPAPDGSLVDAQGRVVVDGLAPGTYDVTFGAALDAAALGAGAQALAAGKVAGVSVAAGQVADLGVVPLFTGSFAAGKVTDAASGAPVSGARVTARPSGAGAVPGAAAAALTATTDAGGFYFLPGLDPSVRVYDLTAAPRGMLVTGAPMPPYAAKRALSVDASSGAVVNFALAPAASVVTGRVVSASGAPLTSSLGPGDPAGPGAAVTLQAAGVAPSEDPLSDLAVRTRPDGTFVIPSVAPGSYRLTASALGQGGAARAVVVVSSSADLGNVTLGAGGSLSGALRLPDGSAPSTDEVLAVAAASPDSSDFVYAALTTDPTGRAVSGYSLGGLTPGRTYRLIVAGPGGFAYAPPEASSVVLASSADARALDLTLRPASGPVSFRASRSGSRWLVTARFPRPIRSRYAFDADPAVLLATSSASGTLSGGELSADLQSVSAYYSPGPGETTAVFRASASLAATDWNSSNPAARELIAGATAALSLMGDGLTRATAANALGATLTFDGDPGRVVLPRGAFAVDSASSVAVSFSRSASPAAFAAGAPPAPFAGPFYDVSLPAGVPTTLARPAQLTLAYSSAVADASRLNVYWYNPAAGAYILQPDALGAPLTVDSSARTVSLRVNHFSTYVLLDSAAGAIGGSPFGGGELDAFNFPNPFDLSVKTVTTIHGGGSPTVRGTLIRVSVPPGLSGAGAFRVFDITGRLLRTIDLGALTGGQVYYQGWDGRNDAGLDVASGLYLGQVEVGSRRKNFKMAVLK